ncbi:MAG: hypothetical protein EA351_08140 [Gemmatimonadales bacterium]|nr:MAG: hypothetical protein EA351_08140 [Gemmatimonadales bacterium]
MPLTAGPAPGLPFMGTPFGCVEASPAHPLPPELAESSGIVQGDPSRSAPLDPAAHVPPDPSDDRTPPFFWSHNDSGHPPDLFAIDGQGELLGITRVTGAQNVDWEELSAGPCPSGRTGRAGDPGDPGQPGHTARCLYIADVGDNLEQRTDPAIYRIPEPRPGDSVSAPAERFALELPDGPRDIEAVYLLPGERLFLITKGRNHPVEIYRVPPLTSPDRPLRVTRIQTLTPGPPSLPRLVTGASASEDGRWVAIRTYETLEFFTPSEEGTLAPTPQGRLNLRPLREPQGEAIAILDGGHVVLTSEAGPGLELGMMQFLHCPGLSPR